MRDVLREHRGLRRTNIIPAQVASNLIVLERDSPSIRNLLRRPEPRHGATEERRVANLLAAKFTGFGPKQSRNVLQFLGLTVHEIPLDSRMTAWLNEFGFPIRLSASALADPHYYAFVSDGVQVLCERAGVVPCVFDAAVFSSFDAKSRDP